MNGKAAASLVGFGLQLLALCLFSIGFFEFPSNKNYGSSDKNESIVNVPPQYDRLVFILIDALRSDFVYGPNSGFEFVNELLHSDPDHARGFIAMAKAPTVTMPRLKALTAGSPPIFLDLILNFDETGLASSESTTVEQKCGTSGFTQDNWVRGLKQAGRKIVFYGDDTWLRLFPHCFDEQHGVSSFFVQDYTDVDNQVTERLIPRIQDSDWDALILHYLGIDHIGHVDGAFSPLMKPKQQEMDKIIRMVYETLKRKDEEEGRSSLILILGDHGMADNGNHGGSSEPEVSTAAIALSPSRFLSKPQSSGHRVVNQVDFAPTLSSLFGLPIPAGSTGVFIEDMLPRDTPNEILGDILQSNVNQLSSCLDMPNAIEENLNGELTSLRQKLDVLRIKIAELSGEYNLPRMLLGIVITAVCICISFYRMSQFELHRLGELLFALVYVVLQTSSSFIEEEHEFWYFALASLIFIRFLHSGTDLVSLIIPLLSRIPRYWNAIGYQRAQDVDARSWLPPGSWMSFVFLLLPLVIGLYRYRKQSSLWPLYFIASLFVTAFKMASVEKSKEILLARLCYGVILGTLVLHLMKYGLNGNLRWILCLFFTFLLKTHNAAIVGVLALIGDILESWLHSDHILNDMLILIFVHYSYFALGPSNLLVSLDFSNAYIGLTQFNMVLISTITFLMTWSGPLTASLLFIGHKSRSTRCLVSDLSLWRSLVAIGLLINLTIQRNHLFIWSVFAPRLLFEFGWAIFYSLLLVLI